MSRVALLTPPEQHILCEAGDRPHQGTLYLAANLRRHGHDPVICDLNHMSYKELHEKLPKTKLSWSSYYCWWSACYCRSYKYKKTL